MANIRSYPTATAKSSDSILGTSTPSPDTNDNPKTVNFPVSSISTLIAAEIPQGVPGPAGADGADGANGINGTNGQNGADGADGAPGANGLNGADGAPGVNGSNGVDGQDGAQGPVGADGTSIEIQGTKLTVADLPATGNTVGDLWIIDQTGGGATAGDGYVWTAENTWLNIGPLRGPEGIQGVAGINGANGINGLPGTNGTNGTNGADGAQGATGPAGANGIDGVDGANGAPGATGAQGTQGIQGIKGDKGDQGDQGDQGPRGLKGATGATGPAGVLQSVVAGTNVTVDNSDPANPIINATGGGGGGGITGSGTIGSLPIWTGTSELGDSFLQKGSTVDSLQTSNATASGTGSIAFGQNAQAISFRSVAIGASSLADTGTNPIALGYQAKARNDSTVSIGYNTESTGRRSTAIGAESQAYALSSTAIGRARVDATADYSVAIGVGSSRPVASGVQSIIIGEGGEASGLISMIFGYFSTATGQGSKVIAGNSASATGNYAVCSGSNTEAHDAYETVFGIFNKISTGSQTTRPFSPPNNIFVVGNGNSTVDRSNALELNDDGELTLPFYASTLRKTGFAVEINTGKIITADAPNYTSSQVIVGSSGAGLNIDASSRGILFMAWSGIDGDFDMMLPNATLPVNYYRKFKFVLSSIFSGGGKNVIITPNVGQTINGAASFTIPSNSYNVVEIWNRGGEWIITSKLIN
jgi:hypothetical protein